MALTNISGDGVLQAAVELLVRSHKPDMPRWAILDPAAACKIAVEMARKIDAALDKNPKSG